MVLVAVLPVESNAAQITSLIRLFDQYWTAPLTLAAMYLSYQIQLVVGTSKLHYYCQVMYIA